MSPDLQGLGKSFMVDVESGANDEEMDPVQVRLDFGENSGHFLSTHQEIIGPFDINIQTGDPLDRSVKRYSTCQRKEWSETRGNRRPQHNGKIQAALGLGMPRPAHAAATSSLRLRQNQGAVWNAPPMHKQTHRETVCRVDRVEVIETPAQTAGSKP
jgi:hypothetical protein